MSELDEQKSITFEIKPNRQIYFAQIEGKVKINDIILKAGDAIEITNENLLNIKALTTAHFLFIEMEQKEV